MDGELGGGSGFFDSPAGGCRKTPGIVIARPPKADVVISYFVQSGVPV